MAILTTDLLTNPEPIPYGVTFRSKLCIHNFGCCLSNLSGTMQLTKSGIGQLVNWTVLNMIEQDI